jgi:hypothetical protein
MHLALAMGTWKLLRMLSSKPAFEPTHFAVPTGVFTLFLHDQAALKCVMQQYLTRLTDSLAFWNGSTVARLEQGEEPLWPNLQEYATHADLLRAESSFGYVGMHVPHRASQVRPHRCAGSAAANACQHRIRPGECNDHGMCAVVRTSTHTALFRHVGVPCQCTGRQLFLT